MTAASRSESKIQYKLATNPSEHHISHFVTVLSLSPTCRLLVFLIPCDYSANHVPTPPRFSRKYSCCPSVAGIILLPELCRYFRQRNYRHTFAVRALQGSPADRRRTRAHIAAHAPHMGHVH